MDVFRNPFPPGTIRYNTTIARAAVPIVLLVYYPPPENTIETVSHGRFHGEFEPSLRITAATRALPPSGFVDDVRQRRHLITSSLDDSVTSASVRPRTFAIFVARTRPSFNPNVGRVFREICFLRFSTSTLAPLTFSRIFPGFD